MRHLAYSRRGPTVVASALLIVSALAPLPAWAQSSDSTRPMYGVPDDVVL